MVGWGGSFARADSNEATLRTGWVLHSALLVPYHSWRISHGKHHNNTGSCENDEVFAPPVKEDLVDEILLHSPLFNLFQIVMMLTIGWMPGYLILNATGPRKYRVRTHTPHIISSSVSCVRQRHRVPTNYRLIDLTPPNDDDDDRAR